MEKDISKLRLLKRKTGVPSFQRAMIYSACAHLFLILFIILFPPDSFVGNPNPEELIWVELPKGSGEDIYGLKDVKTLPESTIQEQKEEAVKPLKPLEEPDAMKEPAQPEPKKVVKKDEPKKTPVPKTPSKMQSALAKIDQKLKDRRVVTPDAAQVNSDGSGYKYGTSDKPVRVSIDDPEYLKYQAMIRARIMSQWVLPGSLLQLPAESRPVVRIVVLIGKSGDVVSKQWAMKSQMESLNASSMRAIERASPFPIPPERIKWEAYNEGFLVEFNARRK